MSATAKSGAQIGAENATRLKAYFAGLQAAGQGLPERDGKANISAIALAAGVDRQVLYKNPAAAAALAEAVALLGLAPPQRQEPQVAARDGRDQRILKLEQENAALKAENLDLRRRVRRLEHVESHMVETGRRTAR